MDVVKDRNILTGISNIKEIDTFISKSTLNKIKSDYNIFDDKVLDVKGEPLDVELDKDNNTYFLNKPTKLKFFTFHSVRNKNGKFYNY